MTQSTRDLITGEITLDYLVRRASEGWKVFAVEWVREAKQSDDARRISGPVIGEDEASKLPYGLQFAEGGLHLEENSVETAVLLLILEQIIREKRVSEIAHQLNFAGYRTRSGGPWNSSAVFNLLPRLIEVGPALLKSPAWEARRERVSKPS